MSARQSLHGCGGTSSSSWEPVKCEPLEMRAFLPALRCDPYAGALPWVAAQAARGSTVHTFGGYGIGAAYPKHRDVVDLAFRRAAKGLSVDVGGLVDGAPADPGNPKSLPRPRAPFAWDKVRWREVEARGHVFKEHVNI